MLDSLMQLIDEEISKALEAYKSSEIKMVGTNPKGRSITVEKEIPEYLQPGIATGIQMRLQAVELYKKAEEMETKANDLLMPNLVVAAVKTITLDNIGQITYKEGRRNSSTYPVDRIKAEGLVLGFTADDIAKAFPAKVDPKAVLKELGYTDKQIKELWLAAEKKPDKEKGDPSLSFTTWEKYLDKCKGGKKDDSSKG